LKKYSYVTCRGEQSSSKFDTYSRQVKSTFGWEADLNTLTARQLKLTFGNKRLTAVMFKFEQATISMQLLKVQGTVPSLMYPNK